VLVTRQHALAGAFWTAAQRWAVRLTTLAVFVILSRLLEPKEFGLVALASVFVGFVNVFSDFGLPSYLVQASVVDQRAKSTVFWCGLALSTVLALGLAGASPAIAGMFSLPDLAPVLAVMSLSIILSAFSATPSALLRRDLQFRTIALRSVLATVLSGTVASAVAFAGGGAWALVAQALTYNSASAMVLWIASGWRPSFEFDLRTARSAGGYGVSILGIQLLGQVRQRGTGLIIGAIAGATALGYWTVASRIVGVVFDTVVQVISTVSTPVFARLKADRDRLRRGYLQAVSLSLALVTPILTALLVSSPVAIKLVFGPKWESTVTIAQIMCASTLFAAMVYFDRGLMVAVGRQKLELVFSLVTTLSGLVIFAVTVPFGLEAAAWAALARAVVTWPVRVRITARILQFPVAPYVMTQGRTLLAGVISALPATVLGSRLQGHTADWLTVCLIGAAVLGVYVVALRLLNPRILKEVLQSSRGFGRKGAARPVTKAEEVLHGW
jgi:teichuronic acid exporter